MKCIFCQGEMKKSTAPFHIDRKGVHISFDAIPAWVCSQCGEPCFEEHDVKSMQDLATEVEEKMQKLASSILS